MSTPASLSRRRPADKDTRWRGLLLFMSCLASACLVLLSGLTIALMQFQARLMQADADFSPGNIVMYAEMDKEMRRERNDLDKLFARTAALNAQVVAVLGEVNYRIDHICKSLNLPAERNAMCHAFLQTIPFNLGETGSLEARAPIANVDKVEVASTQLQSFEANGKLNAVLVSNLGTRLQLEAAQTELLGLHGSSFRDIAQLNVRLRFKILRRFFEASGQVMSRCSRIIHFAEAMDPYRRFDVRDCNTKMTEVSYAASLLSGPLPTPEPPVAPSGEPEAQNVSADAGSNILGQSDIAGTPRAGTLPQAAPQAIETAPPEGLETTPPEQANPSRPYVGGLIQGSAATGRNDVRQLNFELVSQYLFYDWLSFGLLSRLLITPNDFIAFTLVGFCGVLGGLLKLIVAHTKTGKLSSWRDFMTTLLLGLICALIVYALFRAGFLALTTQSSASADDNISPFVIALMALGSGFISDRAIDTFRNWIDNKIGEGDDDDVERWAFGLASVMDHKKMNSQELSQRLSVSQQLVEDWMVEKTAVDSDYQERIRLVLDSPRRYLFTLDPPQEQAG